MINLKIGGMIVAAFIAGAFVASPELRAYAANTVFSTDIVDGEVKTVDIGNGAVTNSKIATNAITTTKIGAGAVTNGDIAGNAVTTGKIMDGNVLAADIATDAVGADELKGVSSLIFADCAFIDGTNYAPGALTYFDCLVGGESTDHVIASLKVTDTNCFAIVNTEKVTADIVVVWVRNICSTNAQINNAELSIIDFQQ
jgi:hypothetical protein